ncbi:Bromodomain-containing protein [Pluteus cervinus]|uniref:Bromodomain-containing protein n=1 Tax=Pluteus cervinus TaxID=181527 RepID=A0ACD3BHM6_9AGAR|nr:Bromodomain-containing protein [Pluteus cervinus]
MSKREHFVTAEAREGPYAKRRKEAVGGDDESDVDVVMSDPPSGKVGGNGEGIASSPEAVREQGLRLWQTVKDAVNKEYNRLIATAFLRKPPKRQYPDYYQLIQNPIALDDIKKRLDTQSYSTLEAVKADFELCFNNAKTYNMKESEIWRDAKDLMKLVHKTYSKMVPSEDDGEDGDKKGKNKGPNLTRLMKTRLQKLIEKTDETGRVLSTEFMELPSRKEWPIYYKEIKHPQCFENIFKHIKRKEYHTAASFAADVELIFSNAMTFNQEHTIIWEDARTLKDTFKQLMSDLPPPFSLPEYSKPSNGKIKIKMPAGVHLNAPTPSNTNTQSQGASAGSGSLLLRLPNKLPPTASIGQPVPTPSSAATSDRASQSATISPPPQSVAPTPSKPQPTPQPPQTQQVQPTSRQVIAAPAAPSTPQVSYSLRGFSHYPNATYSHAMAASSAASPAPLAQQPAAAAKPTPAPLHAHQLKGVLVRTQPGGRLITLDYRHGVKFWAVRLDNSDAELRVSDITFLGDEEEESSGEEDHADDKQEEEEEEEEEPMETPTRNGRRRGRAKGRARPKAAAKAALAKARAAKVVKKKTAKHGNLEVKLNGVLLTNEEGGSGAWVVKLSVGTNTIDVGENGGLVWRLHAERSRA